MSYQSEVLADSPLLYLRFEETSGATCANIGSLGGSATANGTFTRNIATGMAGVGVGIDLDGVGNNDFVSYPDTAALDITGDVTYECWANLDTNPTPGGWTLMAKGFGGGGTGYSVRIDSSTRQITIEKSGTTFLLQRTGFPAAGAWHHFAFTRSGNTYAIYIDGAQLGSTGSNSTAITATNQPFTVGQDTNSTSDGFDGKIDEVAVYNTALSAARIAAHYAARNTGATVAPVADFTGTPLTGTYPLSVAFTDSSTNTPTSWAWTFGDGGTSTSQNPSHSYTAAGTYTVVLIATNAGGSDTKTRTGYVTVSAPVVAPVANFSASPLSGDRPLTVVFTDSSTNTPTSWAWTFGDGGTSTSQNPSHTYTHAGHYTVTLVATNSAGSDTKTRTAYVTVTIPQIAGVLSIAFNDVPMEPDPAWVRIDTLTGCRVRDFTIDRGRPTEFDKTDVGTAVVRIVDRAGLFDPTNTASPYYGKVLPGKQAAVCLLNPVNDTWHTLFRGFVESWHYVLGRTEQHMELELQLVDGFAILARAMLEVGVDGALPPFDDFPEPQKKALEELAQGNVLYGETTGTLSDRIQAVLEDVDWPDEWREGGVDIFSGNVNVGPKAYGPGTSALDALFDCADAEFPGVANLWISAGDRAGHLIFHGRQARFRPDVAEYQIAKYTVGDPSALPVATEAVIPVSELEWSNGQDNLFNACSATPQWVGTGGGIRQLDPAKDNVAGQYVKAGDAGLTSGAGYDAASIAHYGLRSLTFDNLQTVEGIHTGNNSMQETKLFATYYVENYSQAPAPRISRMVFKARRPSDPKAPALWAFLCNVEISDLLRLRTNHPGAGGFDADWYVEGLHYTGQPGGGDIPEIVELSLDLSPKAHWTTNPFDADTDP